MKKLKFIFGKLSIFYYILFLVVTCILCKSGSTRQLKFAFFALGIFLVISLCIWIGCLIAEKENPFKMKGALRKTVFGTELLILLVVTVGCISYIVYTAIPYNGALSWKVDSLFKTKKIEYEHNNFFRDGAEGLIKDINKKLKLPDELYITDSFEMSFDKDGTITRVSAYLYGQNEKGKDKTYLIDYDIDKSDKIVVQIAGYANADYDDDKKLDPMFTILEKSDCKMQVTQWNLNYAFADNPPEYEILYYGKCSFASSEGLVYLPGDVDGDGAVSGMTDFTALDSGGEALGYEVSLYLPQDESVTPVRYMMEPEYISPDTISQNEQAEKDSQAKEQGKENNTWTVDTDGSGVVRFFLNEQKGWKLSVVDAALGTRYYKLETTSDGGYNWITVNEDPFDGNGGAGEGIQFFDEQFGFIGLSGASQTHSSIYVTKDGGKTLKEIELPMDTVTEYPPHMQEYGFTLEDYQYLEMPQQDGENYTIHVMTQSGETEGLVFTSEDQGENWSFTGVFDENNLS